MPFVRNRYILLIIISILLFVTSLAEIPETREESINDDSSEATPVVLNQDEFLRQITAAYQNNCISGTRIMMESGETARYRYEYVMRNGYNKVVSLSMPYRVTWYRYDQKGYLILDGKRTLMDDKMKDLEDVFLEDLESDIVEIKITEILYSGIPAYYTSIYGEDFTYRVILLKESMNFIRIEKQTLGKQIVMFYDNLNVGDKKSFENQMIWYKEIPIGSTFKPEIESTITLDDSATVAVDSLSEEKRLALKFEEMMIPLKEEYSIAKSETVEFPDAVAKLMTLTNEELEAAFVISIVIYNTNSAQRSENLFGKVPENYNHYQKIKDNVEVNVIGAHEEEFLKSIADRILQE